MASYPQHLRRREAPGGVTAPAIANHRNVLPQLLGEWRTHSPVTSAVAALAERGAEDDADEVELAELEVPSSDDVSDSLSEVDEEVSGSTDGAARVLALAFALVGATILAWVALLATLGVPRTPCSCPRLTTRLRRAAALPPAFLRWFLSPAAATPPEAARRHRTGGAVGGEVWGERAICAA
eukprot:CAMPEP_0117516214 /NCGR_PEP_ID=MMETSP0784-20121206/30978_1 /TAXON_ID=39447 /ORGANISM="" /LENGTH=181 /DNA_ID=CAMNT_0005312051 /DNA_START=197 /DNA_END=745 /DNA_ORIENTATION=+